MNSQYPWAIELIRQGRWDEAHEIVQTGRNPMACWIHAWLHRQEGDHGNASYWYSLAGKEFPDLSLEDELEFISKALSQ